MTIIEQFIELFGYDQRKAMTENLANMSDERKAELTQRILNANELAKKALEAAEEYRAATAAAANRAK